MCSELKVDTISEKTSAGGVTIDGVKLKDNAVETNTISEGTSGSGVTIDGALIKDNLLSSSAGGGLVLLSSATASNSSELLFDNFVDTSNYAFYKIFTENIVPATNAAYLRITFRQGGASGSDLNGTYYGMQWAARGNSAISGFDSNFSQTNEGDVSNAFTNSAGASGTRSWIDYFPSDGTYGGTSYRAQIIGEDSSGNIEARVRARHLDSTTAATGAVFRMSSGNITSGSIYIYGVKK